MKKLQFSVIVFVLVAFVCTANALTTPYSLSGHVYDSDGATGVVGANITFTNQNSSEVIYCDSTSGGEYQQDAANFASGYFNGDTIQYHVVYNTQNNITTVPIDVSGGGTSLNIVLSSATVTVTTTATGTAIDRMSNIFFLVFLFLMGLLFLFYSWLGLEKYNYTDIIAAFLSGLIFFMVAYYNLSILGYGWLSLFVVMLALIQIMFMVVKLIDVFQEMTARL